MKQYYLTYYAYGFLWRIRCFVFDCFHIIGNPFPERPHLVTAILPSLVPTTLRSTPNRFGYIYYMALIWYYHAHTISSIVLLLSKCTSALPNLIRLMGVRCFWLRLLKSMFLSSTTVVELMQSTISIRFISCRTTARCLSCHSPPPTGPHSFSPRVCTGHAWCSEPSAGRAPVRGATTRPRLYGTCVVCPPE